MTHNQIEYWKLEESKRSNLANEAENKRHNVASEGETYRHNYATEGETGRHNRTTELIDMSKYYETVRSNQANEALTSDRNAIERGKLGETVRSNEANEAIRQGNLDETVRHNKVSETLSFYDTTMGTGARLLTNPYISRSVGGAISTAANTAKAVSTAAKAATGAAVTTALKYGGKVLKKGKLADLPFIITTPEVIKKQSIKPNSRKGDISA